MFIREKTTYYIEGFDREFDSRVAAEEYKRNIENRAQERYTKYLSSSYSLDRLLRDHSLSDYGVWEIKGEDSNADFGGHHYQPSLGLVKGTLDQAIRYATGIDAFYTWGAGGDIVKRDEPKVLEL